MNIFDNNNRETAVKTSHEIGGVIMEIYNTPFDVELKVNRSYLIEADKRGNIVIITLGILGIY